jgi:methylmalonyl-CoA/ethylmalonyl-CoA epimerase
MIEPKGINHIGIAVRSIEDHLDFYEHTLGATFDGIEEVPAQKVRVAFFVLGPPGHEVRLELVEATSPEAGVARFIEKHGEGLHHVAYNVDHLDERLAALKAEGIHLVDERPRAGAHKMRIAFIHPKSAHGVLTELCELPDDRTPDSRKKES